MNQPHYKDLDVHEPDGSTKWTAGGCVGDAQKTTTATGLGITSNRELDITTVEATATWTESEGIFHVNYEVLGAVGDSCFVVFDAVDGPTQTTNLASAGTSSTPALRELCIVGKIYERFFPADYPLRRLGAVKNGGTATKLAVVAGK